jgi:uncharacterized membrane protein
MNDRPTSKWQRRLGRYALVGGLIALVFLLLIPVLGVLAIVLTLIGVGALLGAGLAWYWGRSRR